MTTPIEPPIKHIAIIEDNRDYLQSMVATIEHSDDMCVIWQATQLKEAHTYLSEQTADVIILDLGLPDGSGLDLIPTILAHQPQCAIMVNSAFADESRVFSALQAGALGYLLKDGSPVDLLGEIRLLLAGGSPINPMVARKLLKNTLQANAATDTQSAGHRELLQLSPRETLVLKWICRGYTTTETADIMNVSINTIRTYVRRIYQKLHVSSRSAAIAIARRSGLLED